MFGRKKPAPAPSQESPGTQAVMRQIQAQLKEKPYLGAQIAGKEILQNLLAMSNDEKGVNVELVATILGGLAGRASQSAALFGLRGNDPVLSQLTLNTIGTNDGGTYLVGDALNRPLAESQYSVWSLTAGFLQKVGAPIPDVHEFFAHGASVLGRPEFGRPRYAEGSGAPSTPLEYTDVLWPKFSDSLRRYAPDPQLWPVAYGFAIQEFLGIVHGQFDLEPLVRVIMDSALAVSKVPVPKAA